MKLAGTENILKPFMKIYLDVVKGRYLLLTVLTTLLHSKHASLITFNVHINVHIACG